MRVTKHKESKLGNVHIEMCSCNHCCRGKAVNVTNSESMFVALGIQHAMHMRHIAICDQQALQYFSTLFHKRLDFLTKNC